MKKIAALFVSIALVDPAGPLLPLCRAAEGAPAAKSVAPRVTLERIEVGPDEVKLHLSAEARLYNTFVTASPPRLVLELIGTELSLTSKMQEGSGKYLKRVRAGQFAGDPNPIARVVMDLSRPVDYRITRAGGVLRVLMGGAGSAEAEKLPAPVVVTTPTVKPAEVKPAAPKPAAQAMEAGSMSTDTSDELDAMAAESAKPAPRASVKPASQASSSAGARARRNILATLPRDPITLDFDGAVVTDVLRLLAAKANFNIIYGSDLSGVVNLHLADVPFHEAFNLILTTNRLIATQIGDNILRVTTPKALETERKDSIGVTRVFQINYKKASEIKLQVDAVRTAEKRPGVSNADDINNVLIVTESPDGLLAVERLLAELDTRPRQVLIEAKLVEVGLSKDVHLGIQWDYLGAYPSVGQTADRALNMVGTAGNKLTNTSPGALSNLNPFDKTVESSVGSAGRGTGVILPADKVFGAFTFGRITSNYFLTATLTAAASQGKVKVLSDPKVATLNGKAAKINITTQIPYVTSSVTSTGVASQSVAYTTTGIQLEVTPNITADGRISLAVKPNVSKPSAVAAAAGGTGAVAVDARSVDTNVMVRDGETIVIGGLITDSVSNTVAKVPLLGDIPILGWLFKKKSVIRQRVELLIFVTTKIMPD